MAALLVHVESCSVYDKPPEIMQHMQAIIPFMFVYWTDPVVHLLLHKSSKKEVLCNWSQMNKVSGSCVNLITS